MLAEKERVELWNFILAAKVSLPEPWIVGEDFNTVLNQSERKGSIGFARSMKNFRMFVKAANVIDLPLQGEMEVDWGPKPFRFLNGWLRKKVLIEEGSTQVREGVLEFFKEHFKRKEESRPKWEELEVKKISAQKRLNLEVEFSDEEVWKALGECDGNKAPGPGGLNLNFMKANWEWIKGDFKNFLQKFYEDGSVIKDFNCTFIALIPKIRAPMAFVKGRQIVDIFVIIEEIIPSWKKNGEGGLLVKLDFKKAYDSVSHGFLLKQLWQRNWKGYRGTFSGTGVTLKRKYTVDWGSICKLKKLGGLGVGRMRDKGLSLMVKWVWRFGREDSSLWRKVLCAKCGLCSKALHLDGSKIKSGSHFVRSISKLLCGNHRAHDILHNGFTVVIGNGDKIQFWQKVDMRWVWDIQLRRPLFNWELDQWNYLKMCLESIKLRIGIPDALAWSHCPNGLFSVKSFRKCLEDSIVRNTDMLCEFPWQGICPLKIEIFAWQLLKGRILVKEVLFSFGLQQVVCTDCPLCGGGGESIDHLILHCVRVNEIWRIFMGWWGLFIVSQKLGCLLELPLRLKA
ncbi:hypothetical protein Ddye_013218 [Dipteronia dyeriana]|uniref:Reverse transcriptase zinc-binding domain-containing protein n=1 Tax=Dipteronia dyeriana TaxID=168575 RepID=A0AAD9X605_9ROSI|nr:hypothetical protein Ddye_013218 [Dipteronia dyeriana]